MTLWEEKIKKAEEEYHPWEADIIRAAKEYVEAYHLYRMNPLGLCAYHGPKEDPKWAAYYQLQDAYYKAYGELLSATDVEYGNSEIANTAWEWKYWKVMARKCTFHIGQGESYKAKEIMDEVIRAEENFMKACGLEELYNSPLHYLEHHLPNLKS